MKKIFLSASFAAALLFSVGDGITAPIKYDGSSCRHCLGGSKCKWDEKKANRAAMMGPIPDWEDLDLADQRRFCSSCRWGHVKKWSGNYCDKNKSPGNY